MRCLFVFVFSEEATPYNIPYANRNPAATARAPSSAAATAITIFTLLLRARLSLYIRMAPSGSSLGCGAEIVSRRHGSASAFAAGVAITVS